MMHLLRMNQVSTVARTNKKIHEEPASYRFRPHVVSRAPVSHAVVAVVQQCNHTCGQSPSAAEVVAAEHVVSDVSVTRL